MKALLAFFLLSFVAVVSHAQDAGHTAAVLDNFGDLMLLHESDSKQKMQGDKALYQLRNVMDLSNHGIFDRGRLIGLWEYDCEREEIAWKTFHSPSAAVKKAVKETEIFVRDQLGDARSFSLDSPASRKPRIDFLRKG